ncbi:hypothetical protein V8D89_014331, partial [Ganoderma adspersum]
FHFFLFADVPTRAPHVRELSVVVRSQLPRKPMEPPPNHVPLIIDILTSCPHVQTISRVLDDTFRASMARKIGSEGCSEDSDASKKFWNASTICGSAVKVHRSTLSPPSASSTSITAHGCSFWTPVGLAQFLPRLAPTLEELEIDTFICDPEGIQATQGITMPPVLTMAQHAAVRSLTIGSFVGKPLLDHLQHFFPALDDTLTIRHLDTLTPEDTYADIRATNQHAQEGDRLRVGDSDGSHSGSLAWTKLDRVVCPVPTLYMLGLRCPIRLVRLDRCSSDALRKNPIPHLALSLLLGGELGGLDALLSADSELAGSLTHLTLELVYTHAGRPRKDPGAHTVARFPLSHFLAKMASAFRSQPLHKLTHLRVAILAHVTYPSYAAMLRSDEFMRTAHGHSFDFDGTAAGLVSALSTLRYLFVDTSGSLTARGKGAGGPRVEREHAFWDLARGWRVRVATEHPTQGAAAPDPGVPRPALVELSKEVRETLTRNEELLPWDDD